MVIDLELTAQFIKNDLLEDFNIDSYTAFFKEKEYAGLVVWAEDVHKCIDELYISLDCIIDYRNKKKFKMN